ncbi:hypothetical protein HGI30_13245 [Paenibacillus albicereus]|uniref:Uncharacterized protein n=1 Tax=Paenibacillus albicereus TaxID=2726185 RepID=A0A6H2GYB9_9BACL|nr:hypothetical protein [Paenibacillus albicereus]QJC52433.1 hypothetical protein HGI30_13245 [Paenibacillus albicereus]
MMTLEEKNLIKQLQLKVVELEYSRDVLRRISLEQDAIISEQRQKLDALSTMLCVPEWFIAEFGGRAARLSESEPDARAALWDGLAAALRRTGGDRLN